MAYGYKKKRTSATRKAYLAGKRAGYKSAMKKKKKKFSYRKKKWRY